jgi:hypothetical protein
MNLYDSDYPKWVAAQIGTLRVLTPHPTLDTEHIIEELEAILGDVKSEITTRLVIMFVHLIKLKAQPGDPSSRVWMVTIVEQARQINRRLEGSKSLTGYFEDEIAGAYSDALKQVSILLDIDPTSLPGDLETYSNDVRKHIRAARKP